MTERAGAATMSHDDLMERVGVLREAGESTPREALDAVNPAMIRHWVEAMGETDPRFSGDDAVAPPAMAQVWTMYGLSGERPADDPLHATMRLLDEAGYTSVLGTNCDQTYARFLRPGERVTITSRLEDVAGPKRTGVGEGYFVTTHSTWRVGDEVVATMRFRVLKFRPQPRVDRSRITRPVRNRDNEFFFEGTRAGEIRIQRCNACGELRHPPGPVCPSCHATDRGYVVASGAGKVVSWVTHHAPQVPGRELPLTIALVELDEGVRMLGVFQGPPEELEAGQAVEAAYDRIDDDLTLVAWRRAGERTPEPAARPVAAEAADASATLPSLSIPVTPTLVVSTALATRDFQDVHHDRDLAVQRGSKDIFLNILSTTGLVQRYVGEWAREAVGPDFRVTACELRLGAPAYPGDTLELSGAVASDAGPVVVDVVGRVSLGSHVNARVTIEGGRG